MSLDLVTTNNPPAGQVVENPAANIGGQTQPLHCSFLEIANKSGPSNNQNRGYICERLRCVKLSYERLSCERLSCERLSCGRLSCGRLSCDRLSCERLSCERLSCERLSCGRLSCGKVEL